MEQDYDVVIYLQKLMNYDFDCINIILEFAGYKYRNGKYIKQLDKQDNRYNILNNMPKIIKYMPKIKNCINFKPYYQVKINKERGGIKIIIFISTSIYYNHIHWYMDFAYDYQPEGNKIQIIKYIYRDGNKQNKSEKSNQKMLFSTR